MAIHLPGQVVIETEVPEVPGIIDANITVDNGFFGINGEQVVEVVVNSAHLFVEVLENMFNALTGAAIENEIATETQIGAVVITLIVIVILFKLIWGSNMLEQAALFGIGLAAIFLFFLILWILGVINI